MTEPLKLFDFQQGADNKLAKQQARLLGDDMGLGKTIQAIRIDTQNRTVHDDVHGKGKDNPMKTLIVAPKSVLPSWQEALEREGIGPIYVIDSKNRTPFERAAGDSNKPGYFLCNWEALRLMPLLRKTHWFHIIADEVHKAKSRKAQQTQALKALKTDYKTGLSGTPADNKPDDL